MERFINILIIDNNPENIDNLRAILLGNGNNLIFCNNEMEAFLLLRQLEVGIILMNIESIEIDGFKLLQKLRENPVSKEAFKIVISSNNLSGSNLVKGFRKGAVDYLTTPFNSNLVQAKIEIFKSLYFKNLRINQLLKNIFPINILQDLEMNGKFSPRKVENGVVLFTDFIGFTRHSKHFKPIELLHKLEFYFNKFDEIITRYNLEKIKTIGDAYMALAGVTENNSSPAIRAALAAIEIRDFVLNQKDISIATNTDYWDIRIGIHSGPLVAGIIGKEKMSFDVWGDTVNIAARAEQNSEENKITVTENIIKEISPYFDYSHRGEIEIKNGGIVKMYFIDKIKLENSLFEEGNIPNRELRVRCDLSPMDFDSARRHIINKLKSFLPYNLDYHSVDHTLKVEKAAKRLARLEGVKGDDLILLQTAVLFHDAGFIMQYENNEGFAISFAQKELPNFGYSKENIDVICEIIDKTRPDKEPETLLQKIMCDADHDYLGRVDYFIIAKLLRQEFKNIGRTFTDVEWLDFQIHYLQNKHQFYTRSALNIRQKSKKKRIEELMILKEKAQQKK